MKIIQIYFLILVFLTSGIETKIFGQTELSSFYLKEKQKGDNYLKEGERHQDIGSFTKALKFFDKSLIIYHAINEKKGLGNCYNNIATIYYYQGDYSKALYFYAKSKKLYEKANFKKGISSALNNIGAVYYYLGDYSKTIAFYTQAIAIQEKIGDKRIIAATTQNIGGIYLDIEDYSNAMIYFKKTNIIYKELKDLKGISQNLNGIGKIYMKQKNYPKANECFNQALVIAKKLDDKQTNIDILFNLGKLYSLQGELNKSLSYYNICLGSSQKINSLQYIGISQIEIGNLLNKLGKNRKAIEKCKLGLNIAEKLGSVSVKKDACECLYKAYKSFDNSISALHFYEKSNVYKDSLQFEETSNKMKNMEFQQQQLTDSIANVKKEHAVQLKHKEEVQQQEKQRNIIIISLGFIVIVAIGLWNRLNYVRKSSKALKIEKDRSEKLLLNILPEEIAQELKEKGAVNARDFNLVSILFTDFKSFTQTAELMSPQDLVEEINICFKAFDLITEKYNIEKIKTIGDSYMAAGGIPNPDKNAIKNIVIAGLAMQQFMTKRIIENHKIKKPAFEMRLGIHSGPIVAGIVGLKKFQYDVWGDTVNTASRIESNGMVGKVNISESLYNLIKDEKCFVFQYRGNIHAKGKGEMKMYFVEKNTMLPDNPSVLLEHN